MLEVFSGLLGVLIGSIVTILFHSCSRRPALSLKLHLPEGQNNSGKVILQIKNIGDRNITQSSFVGDVLCKTSDRKSPLFGKHENNTLLIKKSFSPGEEVSFICDLPSGDLSKHNQKDRLVKLSASYKDDFFYAREYEDEHVFIVDYYMNDISKNAIIYDTQG